MKTLSRLLLALLPVLSLAGDGYDRRPPESCVKIVSSAHGAAIDRSFLAQSFTTVGSVVFAQRTMEFDGVDDYLYCPDHDRLSFTDGSGTDRPFTAACWVYLDSTTGTRALIGKEDYDSTNGSEWGLFVTSGKVQGKILAASGNTGKIRTGNTTTLSSATWYHVAMTYSGSETLSGIKLYVNGAEEAAYTASLDTTMNGMANTSAKLYLGINSGTMGTNFNDLDGKLAGVLLFNRELTAAEIGGIYAEGRP